MKDLFIFLGIFVSFLVLFFGNYATFAWVVVRWAKKPKSVNKKGKKVLVQPKCTTAEQIKCCIPVWQAVEVRKALYGTAGVFAPLSIAALAMIIFNLLVSFVFPISSLLLLIAHFLFIIGFIMSWVIYAIVTADCARMYDFGKLTILLNILCPNVFCFYIKNNVPHIMLDMRKDNTFEETTDDTVIKQKPVAR